MSRHSEIEELCNEVAVVLYHHTNIKHLDVMLYSVCLSVIYATFWLEGFVQSWLDLDRVFSDMLAWQQVWGFFRGMYDAMIFDVQSNFCSSLLAISLNRSWWLLTYYPNTVMKSHAVSGYRFTCTD
jgi:hypothetical protein